jgi:hypothetical protein
MLISRLMKIHSIITHVPHWCEIAQVIENGSIYLIHSRLYKCYPYKRYDFIYVKKILLPYKNTIGKTSECYVL